MLESTPMKTLLLALPLLALAACEHTYDGGVEDPEPLPIPREEDRLDISSPDDDGLQYLAWCLEEQRSLGTWQSSRSSAEGAVSDHRGKHEDHTPYVLWRQPVPGRPWKHVPWAGPSDSARLQGK